MVYTVRKFIWPLALVIIIALLASGGVWLSQRQDDGLKTGTLISESATNALVGRSTEVRVPWGRLQVTVSEPVDETEEGTAAGRSASLVGVQVSLGGSEDLLVADRTPEGHLSDPTFTLVADEKEYVLDGLTGWVEDDEIRQVARRQYVALRGVPDQVSLRVGYDGVEQEVDGLTGKLDRDQAESLYAFDPSGGLQPCGDPLWSPGASDIEGVVTACVVTASAQRPYVAGLGWAEEGKRWMVVTVLPGTPSEFAGPGGTYAVEDSDSTYLLDAQGPVESYALNDALPDDVEDDENDPQVVIFKVDRNRPSGLFEVRTRMTGEAEITTGKRGKAKTEIKTLKALVAQGAFV